MVICRKFKPLFDIPKAWNKIKDPECKNVEYWEALAQVSYVYITGGRESSKTFTASLASNDRVVNYGHRELYTRYTLTSAEKSIIPAFMNRSESLGYDQFLTPVGKSIKCNASGGYVDFSGIKSSSGNQTANLKSLEDYSCLTCEELEEYPSLEEFEKIEESIRAKDVQPFTVCIMNPASKKHWAYKFFFTDRGVKPGFNGIKGDTLYIHSTYLDLGKKYVAAKNWIKFEKARVVYERLEPMSEIERQTCSQTDVRQWRYYKYNVLGGWKETEEGIIFDIWDKFDKWPEDKCKLRIFGLDFGFTKDPSVLVECRIYSEDIYAKEHIYATGLMNEDLAAAINNAVGENKAYVVADNARPDKITELNTIVARKGYNFVVMPCKKGQGSVKDGIEKVKTRNLHLHKDSTNLHDEANSYHTIAIINNKGETTYHIVDADNHCFVGDTQITTKEGIKPIKDVTTSDQVLTSKGYRNVLHRFNNGKKKVSDYLMQFDTLSVTLRCTENHKVKTSKGWIEISKLKQGQTVYLTKCLTEKSINSTKESDISHGTINACTGMYGNSKTEFGVKGIIYTTLMKIRRTIGLTIWKRSKLSNIYPITKRKKLKIILNGLRTSKSWGLKPLKNGTLQKRVSNGISNTQRTTTGDHQTYKTEIAINAANHSSPNHIIQDFAPISANQHTGEQRDMITNQDHARHVIKPLRLTSIQKQEFAQGNVQQVYDLMVEDVHEYFANGVLVHNCFDSIRYACNRYNV